ncbi:hypothetical protein OG612_45330 (plasmid) [Streptomyces sp. NBC_01527]|uniref:hypothetical protein n=1 Tax=Streptomyces sp. NBC_01527 TaxID=2903894 RepID=UPI002F9185E9
MPTAPALSDLFLQRLRTLPMRITFREMAAATGRDVSAVGRWQQEPGFPPVADQEGPRGAKRFDRDLFSTFYLTRKLPEAEAGTARGPKVPDALGLVPDTPGLRLIASEIAAYRNVSPDAVAIATLGADFPLEVGVRTSTWEKVQTHLKGASEDEASEEDLLKLGVKKRALQSLVRKGLIERTRARVVHYRLTSAGQGNPPAEGTLQYRGWELLKETYPDSRPVTDLVDAGVSRGNFGVLVKRGHAEMVPPNTYRLTDEGRSTQPTAEFEYDAAEVARYYRGESAPGARRGPLTPETLRDWAAEVGDKCTRAEIARVARRSGPWVATRLLTDGAPQPVGEGRRRGSTTALEYNTLEVCDWLIPVLVEPTANENR